jgi:hypothetical protein
MLRNQKASNSLNLIKPAAAATTQTLPVSLTVLPIPPMGQPLHRSASLVLRRSFLEPKTG